ncbi:hypothetical protein LTR85_006322 [Meristemomyces frigidus]|nr:hypothetical protein LTR85_006322 [Meristemomyces frigidus]
MDQTKTGPAWPDRMPAAREVQDMDMDDEVSEKTGNEHDRRDMVRMGKRQELRREFQFFSIWGYAVILGCSWEFALMQVVTWRDYGFGDHGLTVSHRDGVLSLPNGGTAGTVWMFLVACAGMFFVTLSMAEMASIAPTAGGQYHWCSEFAPKQYQKSLSFFVGFFCVLGWQTSLAAACYASAQQIVAIMVVANPDYAFTGWQTALFSWAVLVFAIFANTVMFRKLPLIEGLIMFLHVFGFFAVVIVLWVTAPRSDSSVLTTFESNGWPSSGVACLVGLNAAIGDIIGADSSVHLSEELKNASWILPRSMIATAVMNYVLGFITIGILLKRLSGEPLPPSRFNLGKSGNAINVIALCFLIVAWFFQFWPSAPNPTPDGMNWSVLIYGACFLFFALYYWFRARHRYSGPVTSVRKDL